jgi:hypothetical protein
VFSYQGWTNLFNNLNDLDHYPGVSNFPGFSYVYRKGVSATSLISYYFLDWDRIDIMLDGN